MSDLTTQILIEIRDEIRKTNTRIDQTNTRLALTNTNLDVMAQGTETGFDRLERRQVESEIRLGTVLSEMGAAVIEIRDFLRDDRSVRSRVDNLESRVAQIETKIAG